MSHGVSIAHAKRLQRKSPSKYVTATRIDEDGRMPRDFHGSSSVRQFLAGKVQALHGLANGTHLCECDFARVNPVGDVVTNLTKVGLRIWSDDNFVRVHLREPFLEVVEHLV